MSSREAVEAHIVKMPYGRTKRLGELLTGWAKHVVRIRDELGSNLSTDQSVWGIHDYIAALNIRDLVAQTIAELEEDDRIVAQRLVDSSDEILRSFTVADPQERVMRIADEGNRDTWWWHVIPTSGPVLAEIVRIGTRLAPP